jgi:hypothetical protein
MDRLNSSINFSAGQQNALSGGVHGQSNHDFKRLFSATSKAQVQGHKKGMMGVRFNPYTGDQP